MEASFAPSLRLRSFAQTTSGATRPQAADVSKPGDISASVDRVLTEAGRVGVLVNNAGINMAKRILELDIGDWSKVFDTNLRSVYLFCKAVWPHFVSRRSGAMLFLIATTLAGAITATSTTWSDDKSSGKSSGAGVTREEARKLKSPVPFSKTSIARGKVLYARACTECHGADGKLYKSACE